MRLIFTCAKDKFHEVIEKIMVFSPCIGKALPWFYGKFFHFLCIPEGDLVISQSEKYSTTIYFFLFRVDTTIRNARANAPRNTIVSNPGVENPLLCTRNVS